MRAQSMSSGHHTSLGGQGNALSDDQLEQLKRYYGFDKPWYVGYGVWLGKVLTGDLGTSYRYKLSRCGT